MYEQTLESLIVKLMPCAPHVSWGFSNLVMVKVTNIPGHSVSSLSPVGSSVPNCPGARRGPTGGAAKSPGWDGMAICSPSGAVKVKDGRPWAGRRALQGETC
ncbi:hypothetical protein L873DRAFT_1820112 [Choiromyces venosus 120613-1]|uniref:Uncharacterized protein n=1 Tax=Choiromyces venosus 120613-1 TaxID=1336337 RepID=A0A3N4J367_9PEZI|nr:hypothetical protein L873DRAFT_1820112 [Choiromyces venosus 120613-1]